MKNRLDTDRLLSLGLGLLSLIALYVLFQQAAGEAGWFWPRRFLAAFLLVVGSLLTHFVIFFLSPDRRRFLLSKLDEKLGRLTVPKAVGAILIALILSGTAYLVYGPYGQPFVEPIARFWLFAQTTWVVSVLINVAHWMQGKKFLHAWALLLAGFAFNLGYFLLKVSTHPFSLDWSETSRYYYASLFFSERIYGLKAAWSPLHPSRYLLQAIPFFLHPLPLGTPLMASFAVGMDACYNGLAIGSKTSTSTVSPFGVVIWLSFLDDRRSLLPPLGDSGSHLGFLSLP